MARHLIRTKKLLEDSVNYLCTQDRLANDTETFNYCGDPDISGLNPFHGARAFSHIFATREDEFYLDFNIGGINRKYMPLMQPIFNSPNRIIFYINAIFDNCIMHFDGLTNHCRIADGPSLARIEYNKHGKDPGSETSFLSMEYLAQYYLENHKDDKVKLYIEEHDLYAKDKNGAYIVERFNNKKIPLYNLVPIELMYPYGCTDGRRTFDICTKIIECINYKDQRYEHQKRHGYGKMIDVAKNEIELTTELIHSKIHGGLKVWGEYVEKAIRHEQLEEQKYTTEVKKVAGNINLSSGKQVGKYLESQGIKVPRKPVTDTARIRAAKWREKGNIEKALEYELGNYALDAKAIKKLAKKHDIPFLGAVTKAKKANKKIGTYYKNYLKLRDLDGIIHAELNQYVAKTGRFSSSNPNLQNLHKEPIRCKHCGLPLEDENEKCKKHSLLELDPEAFLVRKSFIAPEPDELLLFTDYQQQEMIVMLDQAGELSVINKLKSGEYKDFYLATAAVIFEITGLEITRKQAKAIALGLAYGEGIQLLAANLGCSVAEAKKIKQAFFTALPKLKAFDMRLKNEAKRTGKIHNPYGRVTYISKDKDYTALNAFVQGTSADITKKAMVAIGKRLRAEGLKSRISLSIHDELCTIVKEHELQAVKSIISEEMIGAYTANHISLGVDFEISRRNKYGVSAWGEKVPLKEDA